MISFTFSGNIGSTLRKIRAALTIPRGLTTLLLRPIRLLRRIQRAILRAQVLLRVTCDRTNFLLHRWKILLLYLLLALAYQ